MHERDAEHSATTPAAQSCQFPSARFIIRCMQADRIGIVLAELHARCRRDEAGNGQLEPLQHGGEWHVIFMCSQSRRYQ